MEDVNIEIEIIGSIEDDEPILENDSFTDERFIPIEIIGKRNKILKNVFQLTISKVQGKKRRMMRRRRMVLFIWISTATEPALTISLSR